MNSFVMENSIVKPSQKPYGRLPENSTIGFVGEHGSRDFIITTKDDLSAFASISLIIGNLDCGTMTVTTSGSTKTLTKTLTHSMIGRAGRKVCQLVMYNQAGTIVRKSAQFDAYVGPSNMYDESVDGGESIVIINDAVSAAIEEATSAAIEEVLESIPADYSELSSDVENIKDQLEDMAISFTDPLGDGNIVITLGGTS